jgi:hypothetical protein
MIVGVQQRLHSRSIVLLESLERGLPRIMTWWLVCAVAAIALRLATSPLAGGGPDFALLFPYLLLTIAPLISMGLALHWFEHGDSLPQPSIRLARFGRWRSVRPADARRGTLYGTSGLMVSLLVGMLVNVPVRAAEYLVELPAIGGPVPQWLGTLRMMLTLDVALLPSLYVIAFVAALRRVPLFPRLLVAIWGIDLAMQMAIARAVIATGDLPPSVATMLHSVLDGNIKKVLISVVVWGPYLLISRRVNLTYRMRVPA